MAATMKRIVLIAHDSRKKDMKDHLRVLHRLIREGVDIRGYFWWSLMDNYEWLEGLRPRFGLYRVDFDSLDRIPTRSADFFARWIRRHPEPRKP